MEDALSYCMKRLAANNIAYGYLRGVILQACSDMEKAKPRFPKTGISFAVKYLKSSLAEAEKMLETKEVSHG
jgi:hypothetical protein